MSEGKRKRYTLCVPTVPVAMSTQSSLLFNLSDCLSLSPSLFLHWLYCSALMCSPSRKHDKLSTWGGTTGGKVKERETDTGDGAGKRRWHRLRRGTETRIQKPTGWKNGESGKKRWRSENQRMEEKDTGQSVNPRSMWNYFKRCARCQTVELHISKTQNWNERYITIKLYTHIIYKHIHTYIYTY